MSTNGKEPQLSIPTDRMGPVFSDRFPLESSNALTRLLEAKRERGEAILDLTESNPTRVGLVFPVDKILAAINDPRALVYQPSPLGLEEAREAVADYYRSRGHFISPRDIVLTASTSETYGHLFKLLTSPGDHVLIPEPGYPLLEYIARLESIQAQAYPLDSDDGWRIPLGALESQVTGRIRALVLVHPNNPTGSFVRSTEWPRIRRLCRQNRLAVICDEVFFDYAFGTCRPLDLLEETETLVFILNGLSKTCALPQMKLSWMVLRGPEQLKSEARRRLEFILDTYLSVATPVQQALPRLLDLRQPVQEQIRRRLKVNYSFLVKALESSAATVLAPEAGWYAVIRVPTILSEKQWALSLLEHHNTLVHPGYFYRFRRPAYLVVTLLQETGFFREGVARFLALLQELTHPKKRKRNKC